VLSPFVALLIAYLKVKRWAVACRFTIYSLIVLLAIGSVIGYSGILSPPGTKNAFVFLIIPFISWLIIAIVIPITARKSRRLLFDSGIQ